MHYWGSQSLWPTLERTVAKILTAHGQKCYQFRMDTEDASVTCIYIPLDFHAGYLSFNIPPIISMWWIGRWIARTPDLRIVDGLSGLEKHSKFFPNEWNVEHSRLRISCYLLLDVLTAVFWVVFHRKKSYFDSIVIMVSKWIVKISAT